MIHNASRDFRRLEIDRQKRISCDTIHSIMVRIKMAKDSTRADYQIGLDRKRKNTVSQVSSPPMRIRWECNLIGIFYPADPSSTTWRCHASFFRTLNGIRKIDRESNPWGLNRTLLPSAVLSWELVSFACGTLYTV